MTKPIWRVTVKHASDNVVWSEQLVAARTFDAAARKVIRKLHADGDRGIWVSSVELIDAKAIL